MRNLILSFVLATLSFQVYASNLRTVITKYPQDKFEVSLLTFSPGNDLYSIFGHSAIRINNQSQGTDLVYNYGTFDFDAPYFYIRFLLGNLDYSLSKAPFDLVVLSIRKESRSISEIPLNLKNGEIIKLSMLLEHNLLPENKTYKYDFLYDNCATRIFDVLSASLHDSLLIEAEYLSANSFRQLLQPYTDNLPYTQMGIDLLMGFNADKPAVLTEPVFLPDNLQKFVAHFFILTENKTRKLSKTEHPIIPFKKKKNYKGPTPQLIFFSIALLILLSTLIDSYFRPTILYLGNSLIFLSGMFSVILIYLWLGTPHYIFDWNIDLLWLNPLFLLVLFLRNRNSVLFKVFATLSLIASLVGGILSYSIEENWGLFALAILISTHLFALLRNHRNRYLNC